MDKATPAFNKELCEMLNVNVLSLTGKMIPYSRSLTKPENKFYGVSEDYGTFNEVPLPYMFH
jgi:hypothetical protein